jgi:hypothetical protein
MNESPHWTYGELRDMEDSVRALERQVRVCDLYLRAAPDEPETAATMRLKKACIIAISLLKAILKVAGNE